MQQILTWLVAHRNKLIQAICGLSVGLLIALSVTLSIKNKKLSESLEMALNNIEAYLGSLLGSLLANNVLKLEIEGLQYLNDKLLNEIDSVRKELKIKPKQINTAATQTQLLNVKGKKEIDSNIVLLNDTIYTDSIKYNDLTTVHYSIGKDSVFIALDIKNTQYLYIYRDKHYKNKKNFIKRLFTLDFKKVTSYKYDIVNTNDLIDTKDIRIVEAITK